MTLKEQQAEMRARMMALKAAKIKSRPGIRPERVTEHAFGSRNSRNVLANGTATKKCDTCGRETFNPRFCSRSCAATGNNTTFPKRKPEGECGRCWTAISRRKQYCEACQLIVKAEKLEQERRREENYQSWFAPNGERREGPVIEMSVRKAFKPERCWPGKKLTYENTVGELIGQLIGICIAKPPYLRKADAMRYGSLLNELKAFECLAWSPRGNNNKTLVNNIPMGRLPDVLEQWVNSYFAEAHHPMMPAYALDLGRLIEFHVEGSRQLDWDLAGIVEAGEDARRRGIFDSAFRKHFTTQFGGLDVICQVPETEHLIDQPDWMRTLNPRDQFQLRIARCHLSEGWGGSGFYTICKDTDLDCDLMSEFRFAG